MAGKVEQGYYFSRVPQEMLGRVSANGIYLFACLAKFANSEGRCFPGRKIVADMMRCSVDTVDRTMKELRDGDWIRAVPNFRDDGGQTSNDYLLYPYPDTGGSRESAAPASRDDTAAPRRNLAAPNKNQLEQDPDELSMAVAKAPAPLRPRDLIFEAVAEACEMDWHHLTPSSRGQLNRAVREIKEAGNATPDEIKWRARVYHQRLPDCPLSPSAFAKWWPSCGERPLTQTQHDLMSILEDRRRERVRGSKDRGVGVLDVPSWEDDDGDEADLDGESYAP